MLPLATSQAGEVVLIGQVSMLEKAVELIGLLQQCLMQDLLQRLCVAKGEVLSIGLESAPGKQPLAVLQLLAQYLDMPFHVRGGGLLHTRLLGGNAFIALRLGCLFRCEAEQSQQQSDQIECMFHAAKIYFSVTKTAKQCGLFVIFA